MKAYECFCRGDIEMISERGTAQERKRAPTISWRWHDVCNIRKTWVTQS